MFEIEYKGANCVLIITKGTKIVTDPKLSIVGLKDVDTKNSIELVTESRFAANNQDALLVVDGPGEYGIAGIDIVGISAQRHLDDETVGKKSTIYRIEIDKTRIGVVGNVYEKLSDDQLEKIGVLDILIIPVGGNGYTLDSTGAATLVRSIDPKLVVPIHYDDKRLKYEVPQCELKSFVDELGVPVETVSKYKFKPQTAFPASLQVVEITMS